MIDAGWSVFSHTEHATSTCPAMSYIPATTTKSIADPVLYNTVLYQYNTVSTHHTAPHHTTPQRDGGSERSGAGTEAKRVSDGPRRDAPKAKCRTESKRRRPHPGPREVNVNALGQPKPIYRVDRTTDIEHTYAHTQQSTMSRTGRASTPTPPKCRTEPIWHQANNDNDTDSKRRRPPPGTGGERERPRPTHAPTASTKQLTSSTRTHTTINHTIYCIVRYDTSIGRRTQDYEGLRTQWSPSFERHGKRTRSSERPAAP